MKYAVKFWTDPTRITGDFSEVRYIHAQSEQEAIRTACIRFPEWAIEGIKLVHRHAVVMQNPFTKESRRIKIFKSYGSAYDYCDDRDWEVQDMFGTWWQLDIEDLD